MRKKALLKIVEDLRELACSLEKFADLFEEESENSKINNEKKKANEKDISIEDVRAVLTSKSQGGKQKEVKALIEKYGAHKLTVLDTSCYKELLKDAEEL